MSACLWATPPTRHNGHPTCARTRRTSRNRTSGRPRDAFRVTTSWRTTATSHLPLAKLPGRARCQPGHATGPGQAHLPNCGRRRKATLVVVLGSSESIYDCVIQRTRGRVDRCREIGRGHLGLILFSAMFTTVMNVNDQKKYVAFRLHNLASPQSSPFWRSRRWRIRPRFQRPGRWERKWI